MPRSLRMAFVPLAWLAAGCAHGGVRDSQATFAAFVASLPACPDGLKEGSTAVVAGGRAFPGSRLVMTGHLSVVAYGPPCSDQRWKIGAHCGVTWSLWSSAAHPREFEDAPFGDVVILTGSVLPPLSDQRDVEAAQALGDVTVTVVVIAPDRICDPEENLLIGRAPCTVAFSQHMLTVESICRT